MTAPETDQNSQIELFKCEVLDCWLMPKACAKRYARAEASYKGFDGEWLPDQWVQFVATCRYCKIGKYHKSRIKVGRLKKPRQKKPQWGKGVK
jgi:hypothetical protein